MTIKKPMKPVARPAMKMKAPSSGAVADRFKLDAAPVKQASVSSGAVKAAFIAGLLALAVAGVLTFILYQHWEYLMPA